MPRNASRITSSVQRSPMTDSVRAIVQSSRPTSRQRTRRYGSKMELNATPGREAAPAARSEPFAREEETLVELREELLVPLRIGHRGDAENLAVFVGDAPLEVDADGDAVAERRDVRGGVGGRDEETVAGDCAAHAVEEREAEEEARFGGLLRAARVEKPEVEVAVVHEEAVVLQHRDEGLHDAPGVLPAVRAGLDRADGEL